MIKLAYLGWLFWKCLHSMGIKSEATERNWINMAEICTKDKIGEEVKRRSVEYRKCCWKFALKSARLVHFSALLALHQSTFWDSAFVKVDNVKKKHAKTQLRQKPKYAKILIEASDYAIECYHFITPLANIYMPASLLVNIYWRRNIAFAGFYAHGSSSKTRNNILKWVQTHRTAMKLLNLIQMEQSLCWMLITHHGHYRHHQHRSWSSGMTFRLPTMARMKYLKCVENTFFEP